MAPHHDIDNSRPRSESWQKPAISALWAVLLALVGWIYVDAATARADQAKTIQALSERVATQEESTRNIRESLVRIELGVNELRRERTKWTVR